MIIKFLILAVGVFCTVLCYAALVVGKQAGQQEQEYWQRKAREEGKKWTT